jgi:APA family basic amino acid/polyamine antiporter
VADGKVISNRACEERVGCFISAHDARTGKEVWKVSSPEPATIKNGYAMTGAPLIVNGMVITGMAPFRDLDVPAPVYLAVDRVGPSLAWLKPVVTIGATIGLFSTMLSLLYGQSRIFYAMGRDGLLPPAFAWVHSKRRTPWFGTMITAAFAALMGGLFPIGLLGEMVSVGTLLAFALICAGVIYLRIKAPEMERPFKTPLWQLTAPLGVVACLYLVFSLPMATFARLFIWMAIGLVVYFGYAHRHARYSESAAPAE